MDINGGGPGVCRMDSAFGSQLLSTQPTQPSAVFDSRETSSRFAPVLNLKQIKAQDFLHDKLATDAGVRCVCLFGVTDCVSSRALRAVS